MDVQSESSIAACAAQIPALDILVNNAGIFEALPITDTNIPKAKELFDVNVWAYVAVIQAFFAAPAEIIKRHDCQSDFHSSGYFYTFPWDLWRFKGRHWNDYTKPASRAPTFQHPRP